MIMMPQATEVDKAAKAMLILERVIDAGEPKHTPEEGWAQWALKQAEREIEDEDEENERDLDDIQECIDEAFRSKGSCSFELIERLMKAAKYYREEYEKTLRTQPSRH